MQPELERAAQLAAKYLETLETRSVSDESDPTELRAGIEKALTDEGLPPLQVLDEMVADLEPGLLHTATGRFFGWVIGGALPVSIGADWLVSTWDQNAAAYACSPSAATVEDVVADWLKSLFGLPTDASFALVSGCQMAHVTAIAAARHRLLARRDWSVEEQGLFGAPPMRVIVGEHHETLLRALRYLGIGTDAVRNVGLEADGSISMTGLEKELKRDPSAPTLVSLAAGDLNRGAFDPIGAAADLAHQFEAWVHVDGAFGLWAAATPRFRHLVDGIGRADSWATDAHKWLNVPYDSGIVFVDDPEAQHTAMAIPAAYKVEVKNTRDQFEWGPEWSRRARGIPIYAALRTLGRNGVAKMVEQCCDMATRLTDGLAQLPGVEVLSKPVINQALVRFTAEDGDHDARTAAVINAINATGEAWFGPTVWNGMRVMRISVCNHRTDEKDIDRVLEAVERVLEETS